MRNQISLKEIAELANVSTATVSRVINQNGRFSKDTEDRVVQIIEEYGYQPNELARGLRKSRVKAIAIVVPDMTNEHFAQLVQVIQNELFKNDFYSVIYNTNESAEMEERSLLHIRAQKVSGVIYINGQEELEGGLLNLVPTIYIDREPNLEARKNTVFVASDNEYGGYIATKELIEKGCRRIAVITERAGTYVAMQRLVGFRKACNEYGIKIDESLIFEPDPHKQINFDISYKIVKELCKDSVPMDGLFCETDWLASGALAALLESGVDVPDKVKLVGYDNISISYLCQKPLSTVKQDVDKMGKYASNTLLYMINGEPIKERVKKLPVELVKRQTS